MGIGSVFRIRQLGRYRFSQDSFLHLTPSSAGPVSSARLGRVHDAAGDRSWIGDLYVTLSHKCRIDIFMRDRGCSLRFSESAAEHHRTPRLSVLSRTKPFPLHPILYSRSPRRTDPRLLFSIGHQAPLSLRCNGHFAKLAIRSNPPLQRIARRFHPARMQQCQI